MNSDKKILAKGIYWTAIGKYSSVIIGLIVTMVLARLLSPVEFGTITLANVFISFLTMLSSMGIAPAIIQNKELTNNDYASIFSFTFYVGLLISVIFFLSSQGIANFYGNESLIIVCQTLSISLFFSTINMVPNALMSKNLRFKDNAIRTLVIHLITAPISIAAAFFGAGIYSLLISPVISSIGIFIYNHHCYPVSLQLKFDIEPIKKIWRYSIFQFMFQIVNFLTANVDKLLMGKTLGSSDLGYYQKSYQLIQIPASNITSVVYPVLHPIFSKYQAEKILLVTKYERMIKLITSCVFPLASYCFFCGESLINIVYGPNWDAAIPAFKIMSIAIPPLIILPVTGTFFQASNEIKYLFKIGLINAIVAVSSTIIACFIFRTLEAVAYSVLIFNYSSLCVTYYYMYFKVLRLGCLRLLSLFVSPILVSVFISILLYICNIILSDYIWLNLILKSIITIIIVGGYVQLSKQYNLMGLFSTIFRKFKKA